jgi:hypothetical protein
MRALVALPLLLIASPAPAFTDAEDDPMLARTPAASVRVVLPDEDDPKLSRGARRLWSWRDHPVPRVKLAYRRLVAAGLEGGDLTFDAVGLSYYPSSGILRFGLDTEVGIGDRYDSWYLTSGAVLGLQLPARVTPFVEGRFVAGLIGGSYLGQTAVSYIYTGGIDSGIELYYAGRFYLSAAIGWAHPVYSGIDVAYTKANPKLAPHRKEFENDSFTFKIGLGL